jgi:hypothetical protein
MASTALVVSANTTPIPCVPYSSLITTEALPTFLIRSLILSGLCAKPVLGKPTPFYESNCIERNLSLE